MTSTPKSGKHVQVSESENPISPSPLAGPGPGGHKASFKSTKLARRARSFKDDFLGKISQMRSPAGQAGVRSQSPKGRATKPKLTEIDLRSGPNKGPIQELDALSKQTEVSLKHFRDVVAKNKLEMLPGNGTVVLDTVWFINLSIKSSAALSSSSTAISSATKRMFQSVARLIKLCDDALLDAESSELQEENVNEIISQVEESVKALIKLAQAKISAHHQVSYKTTPRSSYGNTSLEMPAQRNSLPDIPLTPREMEILEQTSCVPGIVRNSHSTESILRETTPPPKPPLPPSIISRADPSGLITPPPLPPKKKKNVTDLCHSTDNSPITASLERMSMRSKSPDDSMSILSASDSLDLISNQSRDEEEEEIKAIMGNGNDTEMSLENHNNCDVFGANGLHNSWEESSLSSSISNNLNDHLSFDYHRFSNADSGIMSSQSYHSYSKRSSQQSSISSQWGTQLLAKQSSSNSAMVKSESITQNLDSSLSVRNVASHKMSTSSSTMSTVTNSTHSLTMRDEVDFIDEDLPPALPEKTRRKTDRQPSPYDNVPDSTFGGEIVMPCHMHQSQDNSKPPPIPPKKKHIMAYMEMFGNCSHASDQEFMRHSVHMVQQWPHTPTPGLPTTQSFSVGHSSITSSRSSHTHIQSLTLPSHSCTDQRIPSPLRSPNSVVKIPPQNATPPALPPKTRSRSSSTRSTPPPTPTSSVISEIKPQSPMKTLPDLLEHTAVNSSGVSPKSGDDKIENEEMGLFDFDLMEEMDVEERLILKKPEEDGPELRGGPIDALIIQATKATKNGVFTYQEAFLTTYRTFISPYDLICKLIRRYNYFYDQPEKKPRSREAFALIVRVVVDLTASDLTKPLQNKLMIFVQQLISCGELTLAKALRVKHLERHEAKLQANLNLKNTNMTGIVGSVSLSPRTFTLLDFKSEQIAEQMTLLDAELFMKIEIPEVLIWAQEQNEERSPNLTRFTEHFNKMSYWARTRILTVEGKDVREKYFLKFIKIMKHLRKINNFNSYLALLSALDSAPVRRLEWQKHVQDGLKEYCALIDSTSSFRAYRLALAETQPPCIPYIGLVLQDLTFVHIGNSNLLSDGIINFSKRWQQYNIVENMKKFKKCSYTFKKNERIIQFFQNFDDCLCEDAMWQLSEKIKPRGKKTTQ